MHVYSVGLHVMTSEDKLFNVAYFNAFYV